MRAVDLSSSAPGDDALPQTDAARTTLLLALIAAAGVMLRWAEGLNWSKDGLSYVHGLVARAAAAASALVCALRLSGVIDRRRYFRLALACALIGLGTTIFFYLDVVGSVDPIFYTLISFYGTPRASGAAGFYLSAAGFFGQVVVLLWRRDAVVQPRMRLALQSPWTTAILITIAAAGVTLPWHHELDPQGARGWSSNEGLIALVAAIEAGIVCGLRLSGHIKLLPYAVVGLLCAATGVGALAWFHDNAISAVDLRGYPLLIWWLNAPRSDAGLQESVSAAGFIGMIAVLAWQLWHGRRSNI